MLKRIEITGFKSFAKKASLTFGSRVVGVVGPNGSGKSNVAESFRFVLGEQSMKALRSGKGEDLIWNGSVAVPKANKASVVLTFDNTARLFAYDMPEVTIERSVYRDGQNEYFLNGKQVRLKDVTELLASISVGQSKHHIISQGQADRMLNSSPKERREMLLDSLGLTAVDLKKAEAERNLTKTEVHMKEVEAARKEARPRLLFLEKQMDKARKAEKVRGEFVEKAVQFIVSENSHIFTEKKRLVEESKDPREKLALLTKERDTRREKVFAQKTQSNTTALTETRIRKEQDLARVQQELSDVVRARARISARIELVRESRSETHSPRAQQKKDTVHLEVVHITTLQERESELQNAVRTTGDYAHAFRELTAALVAFWSHVPKQISEPAHTEIAPPTRDISQLEREDVQLRETEDQLVAKKNSLELEVRSLFESISSAKVTTVEGEREVLELSARIAEIATRVREFEHQLEVITEKEARVTALERECEALIGNMFRLARERAPSGVVATVSFTDVERLKIRVEELGGSDEAVDSEYKEAKERDAFLEKELGDVTAARDSIISMIAQLESEMDSRFTSGIRTVNESFEQFFKTLFGGGEASLVEIRNKPARSGKKEIKNMSKETDEQVRTGAGEDEEKAEQGVDIHVHLPKKKVSNLAVLSGGERALTSIALICALSQVNPPPFIILDETDAALDEANSSRFAAMIRELAHKSQCVVITHNRATMAAAGELYGITMGGDGVSKLLSVKLEDAEKVAK